MITCHTFFQEFRARDDMGVIRGIDEDSPSKTGLTCPDWWADQRYLWNGDSLNTIAGVAAPGAERQSLATLVEPGALERGPRPSTETAAFCSRDNG